MKKELKDYLHLYLGCECVFEDCRNEGDKEHGKLIEIGINMACIETVNNEDPYIECTPNEIKPILRPLSDITDEEWSEIEEKIHVLFDAQGMGMIRDNFLSDKNNERCGWHLINDALIELRKRSVDVDGLIESGLAIDKTTLK